MHATMWGDAARVPGAPLAGSAMATRKLPLAASGWAPVARPEVDLEVVIPAYNEEARIGETLGVLLAYLARQPWTSAVVVVDNGSVDRTAEVVDRRIGSRVPVTVIGCADQGKGAAVRRGVLTTNARWVGFCDADLSTPVDTLDHVVPLLQAGAPVVIGSRRCPGARYVTPQPLKRRLGGSAFRRLAARVCPGVADTQCGFKFFDAAVARSLFAECRGDRFAFDVEVLALALSTGLPVTEVPVAWADAEGSTVRFSSGVRALFEVRAMSPQTFATRKAAVAANLAGESADVVPDVRAFPVRRHDVLAEVA